MSLRSLPSAPPPAWREKFLDGLQRQREFLRHGLEFAQRRERLVGELLRLFVELVLGLFATVLQVRARRALPRNCGRAASRCRRGDHVVSELRAHRTDDVALLLQAEQRVREFLDVGFARRPPGPRPTPWSRRRPNARARARRSPRRTWPGRRSSASFFAAASSCPTRPGCGSPCAAPAFRCAAVSRSTCAALR